MKLLKLLEELPLYSDYAKSHKEKDKSEIEELDLEDEEDEDAEGLTDPGDHAKGKAKSGSRWLKANPKNKW